MNKAEFELGVYRRRVEELEAQSLRLVSMLEKEQARSMSLMDKLEKARRIVDEMESGS